MLFSDAVELLLIDCEARRLSPNTISNYRHCLSNLSRPIESKRLEDITLHDLRLLLAKAPEGSVLHVYKAVRRLFLFLEDEEVLTRANPAKRLQRPKVTQRVVEPLSQEQVAKLFELARSRKGYIGVRDSAILALLVGTGLRRAELCGLRDHDVHLREGYVRVLGKGRRERIVPLPSSLKVLLAKYRSRRDSLKSAGRSEFFFRSRHGGPMALEDVTTNMRNLARACGIKSGAVHILRHTFATAYMSHDGADILHLKEIAGWSSLTQVQRYAKPSLTKMQRSMEQFSPANSLKR